MSDIESDPAMDEEMLATRVATPQISECRRSDRQRVTHAKRNDLEAVTMRTYIEKMEKQNDQQGARIDSLLALLTRQNEPRPNRDFKLTSYDVDDSPYCMREWLEIADKSRQTHAVSGDDMILKVGDALRKRASKFFRHWKPLERTWNNLVTDLVCAFPLSTTPYLTIVAIANERSKDAETLSTYCHRKLRLIHSLEGLAFDWDATLSIIEGCLDSTDARTRIKQVRPINETELITIMGQIDNEIRLKRRERQPHDHRRFRSEPYSRNRPTEIRQTMPFTGTCHNCNKSGHKAIDCRKTPMPRDSHKNVDRRVVRFQMNGFADASRNPKILQQTTNQNPCHQTVNQLTKYVTIVRKQDI